jgi:hypothetical protein
MSTAAIGNLSSSYLQQLLASALQSAGITTNTTANTASPAQSDSTQLSPFAQLAATLQQLQQSNPTEYQQVTAQIAANLQSAAQTAQSQGNASAATQLTQLSSDFTSASQTGALPNLQDLAQAVGGSINGSGGNQDQQYSQSTNPGAIILQTLANAGISASNT